MIAVLEKKLGNATRDAYGAALAELGKKHANIVVLDADLSASTKTVVFAKAFPERFFNVGIAEANMVGMAGGLAHSGLIPFISSFASFLTCKGYDQLRMGVALPNLNVKVVSSHGGISLGEDGSSQQSIEDIALMTSLPNFKVIVPADEISTRALITLAGETPGPMYIRTGRPKAPIVHEASTQFAIGKGVSLRSGKDVTLAANGLLVWEALVAAEELQKEGISASVIDLHTVKPIDAQLIVSEAKKTGAFVTAEEHTVWGGLGSAVARVLVENSPVPMELVGIQDTYAQSGQPDELFKKYGLTSAEIVQAARRVVKRKK